MGMDEFSILKEAFIKPKPQPTLGFSLYPKGLPMGAITQVLGLGSTEAMLTLLAENPSLKAAWVEERLSAYPPAFAQHKANLNLLLFVEGGNEFPWALTQLVQSQIFQLVLVASPLKGELTLRRVQLAAERSGCAVVSLCENEGPSWPVRLRLESCGSASLLRPAMKEALG